MALPDVPDWLRVILLILSLVSFIPQLRHTISQKNSTGISIRYLLFNLICATKQFALIFFMVVNNIRDPQAPDIIVHNPLTVGDWLNLAQTSVVALSFLILFITCLYLPSNHRTAQKIAAVAIYIGYLLISVVPIFSDAMTNHGDTSTDRKWVGAIWWGSQTMFLNYIITAFAVAALFFQMKEMRLQPSSHALSRMGLAVQAVTFLLVAVSWYFRVNFPWQEVEQYPLGGFWFWYEVTGWASIDSLVFALVQAVLWCMISRRLDAGNGLSGDETEPLLRAEESQ